MNVAEEAIRDFNARLPLVIDAAEWNDPCISLRGNGWTFNALSDWRIVDERRMVMGAGDKRASEMISKLVGISIVRCEPQTPRPVLDPRFVLDNGQWLEVFSSTAVEPWVLNVPDLVYVASPTNG